MPVGNRPSIVTPSTTPDLPGPEKAVANDLHTDCLVWPSRKYGQELVLDADGAVWASCLSCKSLGRRWYNHWPAIMEQTMGLRSGCKLDFGLEVGSGNYLLFDCLIVVLFCLHYLAHQTGLYISLFLSSVSSSPVLQFSSSFQVSFLFSLIQNTN